MFSLRPQAHPSCQPPSQTTKSNSSILAEINGTEIFVVLVLCPPSSRTNVQVIQLPCVKNAILLFCFFSLQFRRHAINCRLSSTCCNLYWNSYFRLLHHSYHLSSVSFPRRCPSSSIKKGGEWSFKLRRPNVQRRSRPPAVIYPTTTSRLLPLVASNIRVMTSFDAVIKRGKNFPFIPRKPPPTMSCDVYLQYCWTISISEFHQWGSTTPFLGVEVFDGETKSL